jgi:hypothetical protein
MPEAESVEEVKGEVEPEGTTPEVEESETGEDAAPESDEAQAAEDEPEAEDEAEEGTSDPLDELAAKKYGGDRKKLVDGYWNLEKSGAKFHQKIQELEGRISELRSEKEKPPEPEPDPVESDQTVQWLKQQLTALEQTAQQDSQRQIQIINAIDKKREEIAELRGEIKRADDYEKSVLQNKLDQASAQLETLSDKWNTIEERK